MKKKIFISLITLISIASNAHLSAWDVTNALNKKACVTLKLATKEIKKPIAPGKTVTYQPKETWLAKVCREIIVNTFKSGCPKDVTSMGKVHNLKLSKSDFQALKKGIQEKDKKKRNTLIKNTISKGTILTGKLCGYTSFILIQQDSKIYAAAIK